MDVLIVFRVYFVFIDREVFFVYFFILILFYVIIKIVIKNYFKYKYYGLFYKKFCYKKIGMFLRFVGF